jgi:hypothetical protein
MGTPICCCFALSLWVAGRAPLGRKPFDFDVSMSAGALREAITKVPHLKYAAILSLLAVLVVVAGD